MKMEKFKIQRYSASIFSILHEVIEKLNKNDPVGAWEALTSLYYVLPLELERECSEEFNRITAEPAPTRENNLKFLRTTINALDNHGYLKPEYKEVNKIE